MPMTVSERPLFLQQTAAAYEDDRRLARAAGSYVAYRLDDLRALAQKHLTADGCPYCRGPVTVAGLAVGHKTPVARGGKFTFRNLEVCCAACATLKGPLDFQEFRELLLLIAAWPKPVQRHFRARLAAAPALAPLPRPGSLEWFTGSPEPHAPLDIGSRRYHSPFVPRTPVEETAHEVHHG